MGFGQQRTDSLAFVVRKIASESIGFRPLQKKLPWYHPPQSWVHRQSQVFVTPIIHASATLLAPIVASSPQIFAASLPLLAPLPLVSFFPEQSSGPPPQLAAAQTVAAPAFTGTPAAVHAPVSPRTCGLSRQLFWNEFAPVLSQLPLYLHFASPQVLVSVWQARSAS